MITLYRSRHQRSQLPRPPTVMWCRAHWLMANVLSSISLLGALAAVCNQIGVESSPPPPLLQPLLHKGQHGNLSSNVLPLLAGKTFHYCFAVGSVASWIRCWSSEHTIAGSSFARAMHCDTDASADAPFVIQNGPCNSCFQPPCACHLEQQIQNIMALVFQIELNMFWHCSHGCLV